MDETYHYTQVIVCFNDRVVPLIRLLTHTVYLSGSFFPTFRYVRLFFMYQLFSSFIGQNI